MFDTWSHTQHATPRWTGTCRSCGYRGPEQDGQCLARTASPATASSLGPCCAAHRLSLQGSRLQSAAMKLRTPLEPHPRPQHRPQHQPPHQGPRLAAAPVHHRVGAARGRGRTSRSSSLSDAGHVAGGCGQGCCHGGGARPAGARRRLSGVRDRAGGLGGGEQRPALPGRVGGEGECGAGGGEARGRAGCGPAPAVLAPLGGRLCFSLSAGVFGDGFKV